MSEGTAALPSPRRSIATVLVLALGAAAAVGSSWSLLRSQPALGVTNVAVALSFFLVGALLWARREQRRNAVLMALAGLAYLWSYWYEWPAAWLVGPAALVSYVGGYVWFVCAGAVLMRFPEVTFERRREAAYFVLLLGWILGLKTWLVLVGRPEWSNFPADTPWLTIVENRPLHDLLARVFNVGVAALALVMLALLLLRYRRLRPGVERDDSVPLLVAVCAVGALGGLYVFARFLSLPDSAVDLMRLLTALSALATPLAFAATLLRPRLLRSSVADLVPALGAAPTDAEIERSLRFHLRTEDVALVASDDGAPFQAITVPLRASDHSVLGHLALSAAFRRHERLTRAVGAVVAMSIENRRRIDELAALGQRLAVVADEERRELEIVLHNNVQPAMRIIDAGLKQVQRGAPSTIGQELGVIRQQLETTIASLRDLAHGIYPALLRQGGLKVALEDSVLRHLDRRIELDLDGEPLPLPLRYTTYAMCSEAVGNLLKHTEPEVSMTITMRRDETRLTLVITDDGPGGATTDGFGLGRMRDAVIARRGTFDLRSPLGRGTRIEVALPCA